MTSSSDTQRMATLDGNGAVAAIAYKCSEVIAIYPITPSSSMGEQADEWASTGERNLWGDVPQVAEMQSEGGAAGAVHGAVVAGTLATTFTASQGLLLMIPNMYKIAGELQPFVMHVSARTLATHALSIFGDHSDVMACRGTGFAMLCAGSVQEAQDFAAVAHACALRGRVPFLHFFDGFRTSHEVAKIALLQDDQLRAMLDPADLAAHRERALTPDRPKLRGAAANPDTFFQAREAANPYYEALPDLVQTTLDQFSELTGRGYHLVDYVGHPDAERVLVLMGSGAECADETAQWLNQHGERVGVLKVRLYRPFPRAALLAALPKTCRSIAVLDRCKEPGAPGEPLYLDVLAALRHGEADGQLALTPDVIGGRYGLSSKEFTPAMVRAVFDELRRERPRRVFTVGIRDDVTGLSLDYNAAWSIEADDVVRAVFYGLGADGTVGANKNAIKIIGEETAHFAQGYFVYDSKKSGALTVSHLRFGPRPILSSYLIDLASFVGVHQWNFVERYDVLERAAPGATVLLNSPLQPDQVFDALPLPMQRTVLERGLQLFTIDAVAVARQADMGGRINTVMQTCFFALANLFSRDEAMAHIKHAIEKTYAGKGSEAVRKNFAVVDAALDHLQPVPLPDHLTADHDLPPPVPAEAPEFVQRVTALMLAGKGDLLPVSAFAADGMWPTATAQWEKRNLALQIPVWDAELCIQCNKCAVVCPHAAIRAKVFAQDAVATAPPTFKAVPFKARDFGPVHYSIQVAPEDCTGCTLCVEVCPAKDKRQPDRRALAMADQAPLRAQEHDNFQFFLGLPEPDRAQVSLDIKGSQFFQPLFEYSGACSGCGETPYVKLLTQLFGDRLVMANATGCSSIFGGNLPTTPYTTDPQGRGPAWANSLFEDNAEFGMGMRMAIDQLAEQTRSLLRRYRKPAGAELCDALLAAGHASEADFAAQRSRVAELRQRLQSIAEPDARRLAEQADYLVHKSVWIVGGDGWAYDIGFGGLDHVLASGRKVNVLVLDTEVYSNTGGQQSKATPMGAVARFAAAGKASPKKDLGLLAMAYGNVYVAHVALGARDAQTVKALLEAEAFPGPSLVIAYAHCIAHGYDLCHGLSQQKMAVDTGYWPLYRYDPRRADAGGPALHLDSGPPKAELGEYVRQEARFSTVAQRDPQRFERLLAAAQAHVHERYALYAKLADSGRH